MSNPALRSSGANTAPVSTACSRLCLALIASACALGAARAQPAAPPLAPLAHSALLSLEAAPASGGLTLRVQRATGQTPLVVSDLSVSIDGKSVPATASVAPGGFAGAAADAPVPPGVVLADAGAASWPA